ncbi:hypothetical protein B0T22DRAFT_443126 [Podospora appendiculata]|uniref:Transmembrane protein n=1 Tax=Podospora appendiculata TaxID=314037 RepID=A0AAE1CAW5_9PEZI|nr:hypothetical protein B0T22DRAFT_443126 [Podospora appendiculata]
MSDINETLTLAAPAAAWWTTSAAVAAHLLTAVVVFLFRAAVWPFASLWVVLRVLFSPAIYMVRYLAAPVIFVLCLVPKLEALYIFFGIAALVGILAGFIVSAASACCNSLLDLLREPDNASASARATTNKHKMSSPTPLKLIDYGSSRGSFDNDASSQESDFSWHSSDKVTAFGSSSAGKRHLAGRLVSQTIHEEDDSA